MFQNKTILITGGTGSFGGQMVRHLLDKGCREIRIFSRDENKQDSMREQFQNPLLKFYLGDIREKTSIQEAMKGTDLVFHAAALKQVPSCEFFPLEAVRTNVLGSENVINAAVENGVDSLVCLSTDKAVYPINAMGMTKALMEKVAQTAARKIGDGGPVITCVRYGNVVQSRGSVVPRFIKQIQEGQPLTVTEPSMTRFLLSLDDAIDLVETAFREGKQGDLFIRKAPACNLETLVTAIKNVFQATNPVQVIGLRHSEKIFETLANIEELRRAEDLESYLRIPLDARDLNYEKYLTEGDVEEASLDDFTSHNARQMSVQEVEAMLHQQPEIQTALKNLRQPA